jgi:bis(5'-nucleosyl)-tetraphosphatase (symmetrical)
MNDNHAMALYLIGDVQGCNDALGNLLEKLQFSPSRDTLFLLGDLVNRGPDSLGVLRRVMALGHSAQCLLGNHDLHLLAMHLGLHPLKHGDTVQDILQAPDRNALMHWLRHQSMALQYDGVLMVHAGVLPQWSVLQTLQLAGEVESVLRGDGWAHFIAQMYGNQPAAWHDQLQGIERLRVVVNALTRLRFCTPEGEMEFAHHRGVDETPAGYVPWFDVPGRQTADHTVAFGHWSALKPLHRADVLELDTGCVWGGCLSALQLHAHGPGQHQRIEVACRQANHSGA